MSSKNKNNKKANDDLFSEIDGSDSDSYSSRSESSSDDRSYSDDYTNMTDDTRSYASSLSSVKITPEFRQTVKKFLAYDDIIKTKTQEISEIKKLRKPCEDYILKYLESSKLEVINITNGSLQKTKQETKKALNAEIIKKSISKKINDPDLVTQIMDLMESSRKVTTKYNLKRTNKMG